MKELVINSPPSPLAMAMVAAAETPGHRPAKAATAVVTALRAEVEHLSETLRFLQPALNVLHTMLTSEGLKRGAAKAQEMQAAVESALDLQARSTMRPSVIAIVRWVSVETGVSEAMILSSSQSAVASRARTAVMWGARIVFALTFSRIGRALGDRDHSTIMIGVARAKGMIARDPAFRRLTTKLAATFGDLA